MKKIFIVEDDASLRRELTLILELEGYEPCECAHFANAAQESVAAEADAIILDLRLPGTDGLAICRDIRELSQTPILVLTSSDAEFDEVTSLRLGADDYITKPYRPAILLAHLARLLQRSGDSSSALSFAGLSLDTSRAIATYGESSVELSRNEVCILAALMRAKGSIVSRQDLMYELWQTDRFVDDNTLTVNVNRLRRTLEKLDVPEDFLKTHRGMGYSL